jgi:uncharacterized SAM-binding protein YcdF (DUF218 family)
VLLTLSEFLTDYAGFFQANLDLTTKVVLFSQESLVFSLRSAYFWPCLRVSVVIFFLFRLVRVGLNTFTLRAKGTNVSRIVFTRRISILIGIVLFVAALLLPLQWLQFGLTVHTPLTNSDAIVLLAGSRAERVPAAAMLYRDGYAPLIILANDGVRAGFSPKHHHNLYQIERAEEELVSRGVPREKIVKLPYYGSATIFDALAAKKYLFKSGLKKIIVVTSDYHSRRTFWTFRHALKEYTADITVYPAKSFGIGLKAIAGEYGKFAYYIVRYSLLGLVPDANEITLEKL